MVKFTSRLPIVILLAAAAGLAAPQPASAAQSREHGDSLLIHRVQQEKNMNLPRRGLSVARVEKTWGAPQRKLSPRGGDTKKHPQINRWEYSEFYRVLRAQPRDPFGAHTSPAGNNT
ncbi:Lipoprotein SmpA/OmlA domain-containing protein OS=Rhodanobacter lindaniclasticus OX=75310 GN=B1991_02510 PE=4 SV=1 [Rhodanobacter lindaniclasticus]